MENNLLKLKDACMEYAFVHRCTPEVRIGMSDDMAKIYPRYLRSICWGNTGEPDLWDQCFLLAQGKVSYIMALGVLLADGLAGNLAVTSVFPDLNPDSMATLYILYRTEEGDAIFDDPTGSTFSTDFPIVI